MRQSPPNPKRKATAIDRMRAWEREMREQPGAFLTMRLRNPLNNSHGSWQSRWIPAKQAREQTQMACLGFRQPVLLPCKVTMTRYGPMLMDEGCGLNAALKPVRDGAADYLGVKDNDPRIVWAYAQRRAPKGCFGVRIEITPS